MKKLSLIVLTQIILDNLKEIRSMDEKDIPAVFIELQNQQCQEDNIPASEYKSITHVSEDTICDVFPCWFNSDGYKIIESAIEDVGEEIG